MTEESTYQKWVNEHPYYFKDYYEINKDRLKEYQKKYKLENAKKIKAYQKKYMRAWLDNKKKTELQNKIDKFIATLEPIEMQFLEPIVSKTTIASGLEPVVEEIIEPKTTITSGLEPVVEKIDLFATKKDTDEWKPFYMR